jgi:hypothetical protein
MEDELLWCVGHGQALARSAAVWRSPHGPRPTLGGDARACATRFFHGSCVLACSAQMESDGIRWNKMVMMVVIRW